MGPPRPCTQLHAVVLGNHEYWLLVMQLWYVYIIYVCMLRNKYSFV